MRKSNYLRLIPLLLSACVSFGQDSLLTYDDFMSQVMSQHPQVFRADLKSAEGDATVQQAKGGFDPSIGGKAKQKYFDGTQYYSQFNGYLKVPTWFGLSAETGYDNAGGVYINPSDRTPDAGLWYAAINLELGNGLIIDERRATLQKARLFDQATEIERKWMRNNLYFEATHAYLKWAKSYELLRVFQEAVETSKARLEAIKAYATFGDRPEINVVEARIQYQNMLLPLQEVELEWRNAGNALALFLWADGFIPLELNGAVPQELDVAANNYDDIPLEVIDSVLVSHPLLELNDLQIQQNEVDLRLKKEYLKPKVSLTYRALNEPVNAGFFSEYSIANYTWGASVSYPIFTREERGNVKLSEIKLEEQRLKRYEQQNKIDYQIEISLNSLRTMESQLLVSKNNVDDYRTLLQAEVALFENGESSLFIVNARELKLMEAEVKLVEIKTKLKTARANLMFQLLLLDV